jgi:hypothetical protein
MRARNFLHEILKKIGPLKMVRRDGFFIKVKLRGKGGR